MVFNDARAVAARDDGLFGAFVLGWAGVTATMTLSMVYKDPVAYGSLTYLYWYFSGVIAARRVRMALPVKQADPAKGKGQAEAKSPSEFGRSSAAA